MDAAIPMSRPSILINKFIRNEFEKAAPAPMRALSCTRHGVANACAHCCSDNPRTDDCAPVNLLIDSYFSVATKAHFDVLPFMRPTKLHQRFNWHLALDIGHKSNIL